MKHTKFLTALLVLLMVLGVLFVGCNEKTPADGSGTEGGEGTVPEPKPLPPKQS